MLSTDHTVAGTLVRKDHIEWRPEVFLQIPACVRLSGCGVLRQMQTRKHISASARLGQRYFYSFDYLSVFPVFHIIFALALLIRLILGQCLTELTSRLAKQAFYVSACALSGHESLVVCA